ncbi:MAG TPA: nicotinate-nucleotide--dimethylbenzimidazole phosphoribosyltransferase [Chitinophagaceae bacterium]|nr:nicotinate-nucleotide--dimethylbenzimidazole phosphoribosyltransferase [Chitinophagaceae bacterium]
MQPFSVTQLQHIINTKTKPLGSLGLLESLALQLGTIQQTVTPVIKVPHVVVFAADHGIAATGKVNPFPQAVTAQMVLNFVHGGAAINVFCKQNNLSLQVVDAGVAYDFDTSLEQHLHFIAAKVAHGTANYEQQQAITPEQLTQCFDSAAAIVQNIYRKGCNTIGFGEMGIGNTSSAALIMSNVLQLPIQACVGSGTGVVGEQLQTKIQTLTQVYQYHQLQQAIAPELLLQRVGGFEIAMITAAIIEAAALGMTIVIDGFIVTAALLVAKQMQPTVLQHCVFAHCSNEQGHQKMLDYLNVIPLLQLQLRLGEGTGAALAIPLLRCACAFVNEMASFESAGVSNVAE